MPLVLTNLYGFMAKRATVQDIVLTKVAAYSSSSIATNFTSSAFSITPGQVVCSCIHGQRYPSGNLSLSSVTIGGFAATKLVSSIGEQPCAGIWAAEIPGLSSVSVSCVFANTSNGVLINSFTLDNVLTLSASDTITEQGTTSGAAIGGTIDCPAGGVIIGACTGQGLAAPFSWTNLTEQTDTSAGVDESTAADVFATAQTARNVTVDPTGSDAVMVAASLR